MTAAPTCDALVIGASGQDGPFLLGAARGAGLRALGTSRNERDGLIGLDPCDAGAVAALLDRLQPSRIFLLSGQSSVRLSYQCPEETFRSHTLPMLACGEWMRTRHSAARLVYAASGECFGPRKDADPARESDRFAPVNPYGVAKAAAAEMARRYRQDFGLHVANAFLFNHESARRSQNFVFGKLIAGLGAIREGRTREPVRLGDLSARRDWGWAPDYAAGMLAMSDLEAPHDLVLATGKTVALADAVDAVAAAFGLDPARWVTSNPPAPGAADAQFADPSKAAALIGWSGSTPFPDLAGKLVGSAG